jgi:carbamoylphosphate synthase small subunit
MATVSVSQYIDVDVDVELDDIDTWELVDHLRDKGMRIDGALPDGEPDVLGFEYRIWQALRAGRMDEVASICAEMVYARIGRFA